MTDRPSTDQPTEGGANPTPKPKVTRARTTAVGKPAARPVGPGKSGPPAGAATVARASRPTAPKPGDPEDAATPAAGTGVAEGVPGILNIDRGGVDIARATEVNVTRGGITNVEATNVDVRLGGITRVDAKDVAVNLGGIAIARADRISAEMSGVGLAVSGEARVNQSFVRTMFARDVTIDQGAVWNLAAARVTFRRQGFAGVVIARQVDGDVRTLMDWRGALALGVVVGLLAAVFRRR